MNVIPMNSYLKSVDDDVSTLAASPGWVALSLETDQVLLWNSDDQRGAFFVWLVPDVWRPYMALAAPAPGWAANLPHQKTVWLSSRVLPMGWLLAVNAFQHVHRQIALAPLPRAAGLPAALEW